MYYAKHSSMNGIIIGIGGEIGLTSVILSVNKVAFSSLEGLTYL
jgi:hypothetical protein